MAGEGLGDGRQTEGGAQRKTLMSALALSIQRLDVGALQGRQSIPFVAHNTWDRSTQTGIITTPVCLPDVIARDQISQAFPCHVCILNYWQWEWPGNEAGTYIACIGVTIPEPSLVPRPLPRFYFTAVEKYFSPRLRDKIWAEARERGYPEPSSPQRSWYIMNVHTCAPFTTLVIKACNVVLMSIGKLSMNALYIVPSWQLGNVVRLNIIIFAVKF